MGYTVTHFIHGQKTIGTGKHIEPIVDPALGEPCGQVHFADNATCDAAVSAALRAFDAWSDTPPIKRARILFQFRALLEKHQNELAKIVTKEHGKTLDDALGSVARGIEVVEFHCNITQQLQGTYTLQAANQIDCQTIRQPLGVCAGASPFNFPVMVPIWMMIPAIASGNTFILKPSEQAPGAPLKLLELLDDAGLPPGVANCLQGDKTVVDHLLHHPDIKAFTAVASTPVAKHIYTTATQLGKRAHTFGGAKNHALVMPDADMEQTAKAIMGAAYGSAGERCMAISVVVAIGHDTADRLLKQLVPLTRAIRVDAGHKPHTDMGPLISQAHRQRVLNAINDGVAEGAKLIVDGRDFVHPEYPQGFFIGPTLFDDVKEHQSIYQHEIFGPVLCVVRVDDFEHALALVNRHPYGNGTAIFTHDGYFARAFSQRVQVGMVGVNIPIPVPIANHPFGGWKQSAFGDTDMHGEESIHFYTRKKSITSRFAVHETVSNGFAMPTHD